MDDKAFIQTVDINDLPPDCREIAEIIGFDTYMDLLEYCGGGYLYLPTVRTAIKEILYERLISEYNGFNKKELMQKYEVSESTINRLIKSHVTNRKQKSK